MRRLHRRLHVDFIDVEKIRTAKRRQRSKSWRPCRARRSTRDASITPPPRFAKEAPTSVDVGAVGAVGAVSAVIEIFGIFYLKTAGASKSRHRISAKSAGRHLLYRPAIDCQSAVITHIPVSVWYSGAAACCAVFRNAPPLSLNLPLLRGDSILFLRRGPGQKSFWGFSYWSCTPELSFFS